MYTCMRVFNINFLEGILLNSKDERGEREREGTYKV